MDRGLCFIRFMYTGSLMMFLDFPQEHCQGNLYGERGEGEVILYLSERNKVGTMGQPATSRFRRRPPRQQGCHQRTLASDIFRTPRSRSDVSDVESRALRIRGLTL